MNVGAAALCDTTFAGATLGSLGNMRPSHTLGAGVGGERRVRSSEKATCSISCNHPLPTLAITHFQRAFAIDRMRMSPMKSIVSATALVFALIWPAVHSTAALAQAQPAPAGAPANSSANPWGSPNPQIDIAYIEPKDARLQPIFDKLKKRQVLEELQAFLA